MVEMGRMRMKLDDALLLRLKPHVLVLAFNRLESLVPLLGVYA